MVLAHPSLDLSTSTRCSFAPLAVFSYFVSCGQKKATNAKILAKIFQVSLLTPSCFCFCGVSRERNQGTVGNRSIDRYPRSVCDSCVGSWLLPFALCSATVLAAWYRGCRWCEQSRHSFSLAALPRVYCAWLNAIGLISWVPFHVAQSLKMTSMARWCKFSLWSDSEFVDAFFFIKIEKKQGINRGMAATLRVRRVFYTALYCSIV